MALPRSLDLATINRLVDRFEGILYRELRTFLHLHYIPTAGPRKRTSSLLSESLSLSGASTTSSKSFIGATTADILRTFKKSVVPKRTSGENREPVDDIPIDDIPVNNVPVNNVPVNDTPVDNIPVDDILVDAIPVDTSGETSVKNKAKTEPRWKTLLTIFQSKGKRKPQPENSRDKAQRSDQC